MIYLALLYAWRKTVSRCFLRNKDIEFEENGSNTDYLEFSNYEKGDYTKNDRLYIYIIKKV